MRGIAVLAVTVLASASWAGPKAAKPKPAPKPAPKADAKPTIDPKDAALMDRLVDAMEKLVGGIYEMRGWCPRVAQAIKDVTASDNKFAAELAPRTQSAEAEAMQKYAADKHKARFSHVRTLFEDGTLDCRTDKAVVAAWAADEIALAAFGELPAEPAPTRKRTKPVPDGYEAKLKDFDALLFDYDVLGKKFEYVDNDKDCTAKAKLIQTFATAFHKELAAFDALDEALQSAVREDQRRSRIMDRGYIQYMATKGKCLKNKAFMKGDKAYSVLDPEKAKKKGK